MLTEQSPDVTSSESGFVNDLLAGLFGWVPFLYDPETGLWLGMDIRHWAHTAEFLVLGVFVAMSSYLALRPRLLSAGGIALLVCVACSLFDQCHKLFVPGRHFDGLDLAMDALGYGIAILAVLLCAGLMLARCRKRNANGA